MDAALAARDLLESEGISTRVVSMPSFELFRAQDRSYRDEVLPPGLLARVGVEAASPFGWAEWVGLEGATVTIDRFGLSAPGEQALAALGVTPVAIAEAARAQVREHAS